MATFPCAPVIAAIGGFDTACTNELPVRSDHQAIGRSRRRNSGHVDPAVCDQSSAHRIGAFERTRPLMKVFGAVDVIVDPPDERGSSVDTQKRPLIDT